MGSFSLQIGSIKVFIAGPFDVPGVVEATAKAVMAAGVTCDGAGCNAKHSVKVRNRETIEGAKKRAAREALSGAWVRRRGKLYCKRCAEVEVHHG